MNISVFWKAYLEGSVVNGCDGKHLVSRCVIGIVHVLDKPPGFIRRIELDNLYESTFQMTILTIGIISMKEKI